MIGATTLQAAPIQSITYNSGGIEQLYYGQSVTIGSRYDWNTISFAFDMQGGAGFEAYSAGDLYILTEDFLGTADDLSASTSGFLAVSSGYEDGFWTFDRDVTLLADHTYYFAMGAREDATATTLFGGALPGVAPFGNGGALNSLFTGNSLDFALNGEIVVPTPVPLPATALMLMAGIGSLGAFAARRRSKG